MNRGRPVIPYRKDIGALQEIPREARPEAVVECGIATTIRSLCVVHDTVIRYRFKKS